MINTALISHSSYLAGAERMLFNLALVLKNSDKYNPIMYIPKGPSVELETICSENRIEFRYMDEYYQYIFINRNNKKELSKKLLSCTLNIKEQLICDEIELIINNTATSIIPVLLGVELGIPIIGWIHGILDSAFINTTFNNELRLFFDRILIQLSDKVLCCSNWTQNYYEKFGKDKIEVLHNWTEVFEIKRDKVTEVPTFACLNTFDEFKGIFLLLEAVKKLSEITENFQILLYGDGTYKTDIIKNIDENNLGNLVKLMGRTNDITNVYNNITCLIQPSFIESFGMTIIEAMAHGRPVISAKSGGPEELIINEKTGYLIEKNNVDQLVEKMEFIINNPKIASKMGECGEKAYNEKFSIRVASEKVLDILDKTIEEYNGVSTYKQVLFDAVIKLLKSYSETNYVNINLEDKINNSEEINNIIKRPIESDILCFSKSIRKNKKYNIICNVNNLSSIGVLFTGENGKPKGNVTMNIYNKSKLLRKTTLDFREIIFNDWAYFYFDEILGCSGRKMLIELVFNYENKNEYIGIYEDTRNRDFLYKAFNKFNIPLKGLNVLYIDCK